MKILHFIKRQLPHSITMQMQYEAVEVEHEEVFHERELTAFQVKKVCQMQAWASRQLKNYYEELNPAVKEAKQ